MKTVSKRVALLAGIVFTFSGSALFAAEVPSTSLPLTPIQINKLQQLFTANGNAVPVFTNTPNAEHLVWQQTPITVILPVGKERLIHFPESVSFGYDQTQLTDKVLRVQNNNGTLYLLASAPFATQRVMAKLADGQMILLDLSAQEKASDTPLEIVLGNADNESVSPQTSSNTDNISNTISSEQTYPDSAVSYLTLTRFAAQQLYAPKRLLTDSPAIYRTPMHTKKTAPLLNDGQVIAMPLASWRGGDLTVTAILLRNTTAQTVTVDPRSFCGSWRTATVFPRSVLAPNGNATDSTTIFLVSNQDFATSLLPCTRGY